MTDRLTRDATAVLLFRLSFSTANGRMNSIIYDPRLIRRDEWDGGRGWCRILMYVGMGVGGVGRVVVVVRLVWEGWMEEWHGVHGNQLLLG